MLCSIPFGQKMTRTRTGKPHQDIPHAGSCTTPSVTKNPTWSIPKCTHAQPLLAWLVIYDISSLTGGGPPLHTIDDATNLGDSLTRSTRKIIFVLSTHQPHMLLVPTAAAATGPCCTYPCGGQSSYNQSNNNYRAPQLVRQNQIRRCEHEHHMEHNLRRMNDIEAI